MCGIAGLYRPAADIAAEELGSTAADMIANLVHRGPDADGVWVDAEAGIGIGHRRLSIIDLSPNGSQPMVSENGRWIIVFNGEIYNFEELRHELLARGHRFRGHSDTEVLLAAIEEWGLVESLRRSVGMFALALWDRAEKALHLARDRIGEKPLYYGWVGRAFLFGSELKALRAARNWDPTINRQALALLLRHNYIPAPYSIYEGIHKLPPATVFTVRPEMRSDDSPRHYWSLQEVVEAASSRRFAGSEADAVECLDELLRQAVRGQMISDVPLGAFLSGGIDSSAVVAVMQAESKRPVKTFTIGFHEQAYNEAHHAKIVARHLGTDHTELYVTPEDAMAVIPRLPSLYDEPFSDASQIPTFLVAQLARQHVTVALSGDGGDELFGGYNRYFLGRAIWEKIRWLPRPVRSVIAAGITTMSPQVWDDVLTSLARLLPSSLRFRLAGEGLYKLAAILRSGGPEGMYKSLVSHWEDPSAVVQNGSEAATILTDPTKWPKLSDYTERMMYLDSLSYLRDDILVKVDRACMAVSLESRIPLLDHRIVEFAWTLPLSLKVRSDQGKRLLRQVLYRYVPPQLVERPKMGFGVPIDSWLRGPLREWAEDLLNEQRLRNETLFNPEPIRRKWEEHASGRRNWQYHLWDVLMFQAWFQENRSRTQCRQKDGYKSARTVAR